MIQSCNSTLSNFTQNLKKLDSELFFGATDLVGSCCSSIYYEIRDQCKSNLNSLKNVSCALSFGCYSIISIYNIYLMNYQLDKIENRKNRIENLEKQIIPMASLQEAPNLEEEKIGFLTQQNIFDKISIAQEILGLISAVAALMGFIFVSVTAIVVIATVICTIYSVIALFVSFGLFYHTYKKYNEMSTESTEAPKEDFLKEQQKIHKEYLKKELVHYALMISLFLIAIPLNFLSFGMPFIVILSVCLVIFLTDICQNAYHKRKLLEQQQKYLKQFPNFKDSLFFLEELEDAMPKRQKEAS
jgi:hypothetical protein